MSTNIAFRSFPGSASTRASRSFVPLPLALLACLTIAACGDEANNETSFLPLTPRGTGTQEGTPTASSGIGPVGTGPTGYGGRHTTGVEGLFVDDGSGPTGSGTTGSGTTGSARAGLGNMGAGGAGADSPGDAGSADAGQTADIQDLADGQILFVADTLNAGEVDQARAALPRLSDEGVRQFARRMIDEHEAARDQLLELAVAEDLFPEPSQVAIDLRQQSEAMLAELLEAPAGALDSVYLAGQVQAHAQALRLLEDLIEAADAEPLRAQLTRLGVSVERHLTDARRLEEPDFPYLQ